MVASADSMHASMCMPAPLRNENEHHARHAHHRHHRRTGSHPRTHTRIHTPTHAHTHTRACIASFIAW